MAEAKDVNDPKGLIRESYRIDGITEAECRSILVDWALSLPEGAAPAEALGGLVAQYADAQPAHPMSGLLRDGMQTLPVTGRRGGRAGRVRH